MARGGFLGDGDRRALERFPADVSVEDVERCFTLSVSDLDRVTDGFWKSAAVRKDVLKVAPQANMWSRCMLPSRRGLRIDW